MRLSDIRIRDPFVLPVPGEHLYYLFGSTDPDPWTGRGIGFDAYQSSDLLDWSGPTPAFRPDQGFWADRNFWAPEVHAYRGGWFMFASFKSEDRRRATQTLRSERPAGLFRVHAPRPLTPPDWECLDGTLFVDPGGAPWLVFCHEWVQVGDGQICAVALSEDLARTSAEPRILFSASQAPWVREVVDRGGARRGFVTDGPFVFRASDGGLLLLWSSFSDLGYAMGIARSDSGEITGPWRHMPRPVVDCDGGHGMVFRDFSGALFLTYHSPNKTPEERPVFRRVVERDGTLLVVDGEEQHGQ